MEREKDYNLNGAIYIFMKEIKLEDWMIAEEIANQTRAPYEVCLNYVKEARKLPDGLPSVQLLIEGSGHRSRIQEKER